MKNPGFTLAFVDAAERIGFRKIFQDITDEQVEQIFELAEMRAVNVARLHRALTGGGHGTLTGSVHGEILTDL